MNFPDPAVGARFRARSISLIGANIEGEVSIRKAEAIDNSVVWALSLEDARVGDDLWITGSHFAHVTLSGMTVNGFALLQGTTVDYNFLADSLRIGKAVWMSPETRIQGVLNLSSSWVGGDIDFAGAQVIGAPILRSLTTGGDLNMNCGTTFEAPLSAAFAKIGAVLTAFVFPLVLDAAGTNFLLTGLIFASLLGALVTWWFRIETRGVNLEEIGR